VLVDEKIELKDILDKKSEIPLSIASHGVHELCFKLHGTIVSARQ
jgi:hypothetical protein